LAGRQISDFSSPFVWLLDPTGAYQFCLRTDSLGNLIACRASAGPCPDRSGPDQGPGSAPQHMALYRGRRRDRRSGAVRVYVDGAKVLDLPGSIPSSSANQIGIIQGYGNSSATYLFDDLYVIDTATRLGERKITVLTPTADVAKAFTPSTGTDNYACLDEAVPDTTDYVTASAPGATDTYELSDLVTPRPRSTRSSSPRWPARPTRPPARWRFRRSRAARSTMARTSISAPASPRSRASCPRPGNRRGLDPAAVNALRAGPKVTV
jgi:hypothetical protein